MRRTLLLLVVGAALCAPRLLCGQEVQPPSPPAPEFRLPDARSVTPKSAGRLRTTRGTLVSDTREQHLVFLTADTPLFVVPYASITALHYEEGRYPKRAFWRSNYFIVVHYTRDDGRPSTQVVHFVSRENALAAVAALRRDTGVQVDRTPAPRAFLGIAAHAGVGATVVVTDAAGARLKGRITALSPTTVEVAGRSGREWRFDETSLQRIRWQYSARHDAKVGVIGGAALGVLMTWLAAGLSGCYEEGADDCHVGTVMVANAAVLGGVGAALASGIGAMRYPLNGTYEVYRAGPVPLPRRSGVAVIPQVSASRSSLTVAFGF